jgi:carotenoid cleavage dioxygenase-like enzyme
VKRHSLHILTVRRPIPRRRARLCRWTFDLAGNTDQFMRTYLDDVTGEFPRIDERRARIANRNGWYACANPGLPLYGGLSGLVLVDGGASRRGKYLLPAGDTICEPVFVERGDDAAEATVGC